MKKLILIIAFLTFGITNAQDYSFIEKSKSLPSETSAVQFSKEIVATSGANLRLYKSKEIAKQKKFKVVFVPSELKDADIENYNVSDVDKENFISLLFNIDADGKYRLLEVLSKKEFVYPVWQRFYNPNGDNFTDNSKNIHCLFQQQGNLWIIRS